MELRIKLKKFVEDILSKCFNRLLKSTKELAFDTRLSAGQRNADLHFFLLMAFMLKYTRSAKHASSDVSACLHVEAFHHIQVHLDNYLESAATLRKEARHYGIRAQYALSAYKELILFHQYLLDNGSAEEKEQAQRTCGHILIVEEYREMGLALMRKYNPGVLSKTFLRDLVLSTHYYFRLLEKSVKSGELTTVKKRSRVKRKRTKKSAADFAPEPLPAVVDSMSSEDLDRKWSHINEELNEVILGNVEMSADQIPINSLLDVEEELHQKFAMLKVQRAMREGRPADAMGLYRASRAMWLSDGIFGTPDMDAEKEMSELREIFFADLKEVADQLLNAEIAAQKRFAANSMIDEGDEEEYSEEDEEEEPKYETKEIDFDFDEYVGKYAKTEVLRWYVFLLNDFATNSVELNKALVKLLHRVAFDLKMPSRLFQLSLFRIFAQIRTHFNEVSKEDMKKNRFFELYTFGYHLLKRFFACFETLGDKLAPEILFWKGVKECYEIEHGYGTYDESKKHTKEDGAWTWNEELEDELRSLYNEYRDMDERPEGMDVLDFIEPNLSRPRTRKQILSKLKEFGLDPLGAKANKGSILDRNFPIIQMKQLIEEFNAKEDKENEDLVDFIKTRLAETHGEFSRPKIIKQINYLGIDYERKRKPTSKKYKEWTDGLRTELAALKLQYEEMDAEDHELIDLVDYVMRRLSEKKPRRQVERELEALGAVIKRREKPRTSRKKQGKDELNEIGEDEQNPGSYRSESSDAELELEELSDDDRDEASDPSNGLEKENVTPNAKADNIHSVIEDTSRNVTPVKASPLDVEDSQDVPDDSPIRSTKKRKRVLASSDEEDDAVPAEERKERTLSDSPVAVKQKKHRVVLSDSDED
ncbi:timeless protein region [Oesophagostomum dentatum]|uniref:Timeless protein region n=1 Tax=Oesophagostomum dentatum TaxID=61180 RepID=A0A0B1S8P4_OESDE|nr:timeless protein region [Oesophagostomum dentatum]